MSDCIIWSKGCTGRGYGAAYVDGKQIPAHRLSWQTHNGLIPKGLCVLHKCDNRRCVNPDHLFLGTNRDNTADMIRKGRHGGNYKLSRTQAAEIRSSTEDSRVLSQRYGVSRLHVYDIKAKRYWKSL